MPLSVQHARPNHTHTILAEVQDKCITFPPIYLKIDIVHTIKNYYLCGQSLQNGGNTNQSMVVPTFKNSYRVSPQKIVCFSPTVCDTGLSIFPYFNVVFSVAWQNVLSANWKYCLLSSSTARTFLWQNWFFLGAFLEPRLRTTEGSKTAKIINFSKQM